MSRDSYALLVLCCLNAFLGVLPLSADESVLLPLPRESMRALYDKPYDDLNESQRWKIKIHGIRLAALDPSVWSGLRRERTENRRLVPIKRFFLRVSEVPGFELQTLETTIRFKKEGPQYMEKMPHQKDPVFEIGFGGSFREANLLDKPIEDSCYVVRLSAFPRLQNGIFRRDQEQFKKVADINPPNLSVGVDYAIQLSVVGSEVTLRVNGEQWYSGNLPRAAPGLVSLQTSWHPLSMDTLKIIAAMPQAESARQVEFSGLINSNRSLS